MGHASGDLIEADGDGLTQVHGRLAWVSGDFDEAVAVREVSAGESVLFWAEDQSDGGALRFLDLVWNALGFVLSRPGFAAGGGRAA